jgi:hypothetical protein
MAISGDSNLRKNERVDILFSVVIIIGAVISYLAAIIFGGSLAPSPSTNEVQWIWYSFDGYFAFPLGTGIEGLSLIGFIIPLFLWTTFLLYLKSRMRIDLGKSYWILLVGSLVIGFYALRITWTGTVYMLDIGRQLLLLIGIIVSIISKWPRPGLYAFYHMTAIWYAIAFCDIMIGTRFLSHGSGCIGGGNNGIGDGLWVTPFLIALNMLIFSVFAKYIIHTSNVDEKTEHKIESHEL